MLVKTPEMSDERQWNWRFNAQSIIKKYIAASNINTPRENNTATE